MSTTYFTKAVLLLTFLSGFCSAGTENHGESKYVLYVKVSFIYSLSNLVSRASRYTTVKSFIYLFIYFYLFYFYMFFMPTHKLREHWKYYGDWSIWENGTVLTISTLLFIYFFFVFGKMKFSFSVHQADTLESHPCGISQENTRISRESFPGIPGKFICVNLHSWEFSGLYWNRNRQKFSGIPENKMVSFLILGILGNSREQGQVPENSQECQKLIWTIKLHTFSKNSHSLISVIRLWSVQIEAWIELLLFVNVNFNSL